MEKIAQSLSKITEIVSKQKKTTKLKMKEEVSG